MTTTTRPPTMRAVSAALMIVAAAIAVLALYLVTDHDVQSETASCPATQVLLSDAGNPTQKCTTLGALYADLRVAAIAAIDQCPPGKAEIIAKGEYVQGRCRS